MKDLWKLFIAFFKIGLFTIGGGLAMLPLIQRVVVDDYKWLKEQEMVDCIAICQSLPGVIAINVATFIGYRRRKLIGSIAATLGTILPSFIIIILAVICLDVVGSNPYISGAFTALKAASCGLILFAAIKMGKQVLKTKFAWAITIIGFIMITFFKITAVWVVILGALAGIIPYWYKSTKIKNQILKKGKESKSKEVNSDKDIEFKFNKKEDKE